MFDAWLDRSILLSFDRTGFARHARRFEDEPERDLHGRDVVLTGGTAGIGLAAAVALGRRGARLHLWGRQGAAGEAAVDAVRAAGGRASFTSVDLGDLAAVAAAAAALPVATPAALVLNAGAMPLARTLTAQGHELVWASQVLGHLLLVRCLRERGVLGPDTRVVWVSSGGLYAQRLDLSDLRRERGYARHAVYANAKRAQLVLAQELADRWPEIVQAVMHPGWVRTEAVRRSMPVFYRVMGPLLRTPAEGADTVVWLVARDEAPVTGRFWLDRRPQLEHLSAGTREPPEARRALVEEAWDATTPWLPPSSR